MKLPLKIEQECLRQAKRLTRMLYPKTDYVFATARLPLVKYVRSIRNLDLPVARSAFVYGYFDAEEETVYVAMKYGKRQAALTLVHEFCHYLYYAMSCSHVRFNASRADARLDYRPPPVGTMKYEPMPEHLRVNRVLYARP